MGSKRKTLQADLEENSDTSKKLKSQQKSKKNKTPKVDKEESKTEELIQNEEYHEYDHGIWDSTIKDDDETLVVEAPKPDLEKLPQLWPREDLLILFDKMEKMSPKNDKLWFKSRLNRIKWDEIAFGEYTGENCRAMWDFVQKHIRCFRSLQEVLHDAKEWATHPWTNYRSVKSKRHPDMPRKPLTSYIMFYMRHKNKFLNAKPQIDMPTLSKLIAEKYKNLSPAKKEKYIKLSAKARDEYNQKAKEFYQNHPELQPQRRAGEHGPKKPFRLYYEHTVENQDEVEDKNAIMEKCKAKWRKMSGKHKLVWINKALAQTPTDEESEIEFNKKLQNLLTKEERGLKNKMAGKPDKPPASPYRLYAKKYIAENPDVLNLATKERIALISQKWKSCDSEVKKQMKEELKALTALYDKDYQQYLESLTPQDRLDEQLQHEASKTKRLPKKNKNDSEPTSSKTNEDEEVFVIPEGRLYLGEPEPPPLSAFLLYATKKIKKADHPYTKKELQDLWDNLSQKDKCKYDRKLKEMKTTYISNYEKFLKSLSREDLSKFANLKQTSTSQNIKEEKIGSSSESDSGDSSSDSEDSGHDSTSQDKVPNAAASSTDSDSSSD